jgi:hypothetical protein
MRRRANWDIDRRDVLSTGEAAHLGVAREATREEDLVHRATLRLTRAHANVGAVTYCTVRRG